jgi:hypothetical protein
MALGYAQGSIAGVDLEDANGVPCKVLIIDGGNLKPTFGATTVFAADGTPYTQVLELTAGAQFGVKLEFVPPDVLNNVIDAINQAMISSGSFNVTLADDFNNINANCATDGAAWHKISPQRTHEDTVKDVDFRFQTV